MIDVEITVSDVVLLPRRITLILKRGERNHFGF